MTSSSRAASTATVFGVLAIAAVPCGAVAAQYLQSVGLLQSLYITVPIAIVLGLLAVLVARRARRLQSRSVFGGSRSFTRLAQLLAWTGLWIGVTGGVALVVYGALRWAQ
ncbi:MAG TPA: hypothetical protein VF094_13485 [Gaiellaceae bacterium]